MVMCRLGVRAVLIVIQKAREVPRTCVRYFELIGRVCGVVVWWWWWYGGSGGMVVVVKEPIIAPTQSSH